MYLYNIQYLYKSDSKKYLFVSVCICCVFFPEQLASLNVYKCLLQQLQVVIFYLQHSTEVMDLMICSHSPSFFCILDSKIHTQTSLFAY